jgi:hypothetical protein
VLVAAQGVQALLACWPVAAVYHTRVSSVCRLLLLLLLLLRVAVAAAAAAVARPRE